MESRRAGRRGSAHPHRGVVPDPRGAAQAPGVIEDYPFTRKLTGDPVGSRGSVGWDGAEDWEFTSAADDTPEQLYASGTTRSSARGPGSRRRWRAAGSISSCRSAPSGQHASLRRLLCDLVEEYGRHTGHADLLREAVDGRVGEDPPPGWQPLSHR